MSLVLIEESGVQQIVEHTVPIPSYEIGDVVGWPDPSKPGEYIEGTITGYNIDVMLFEDTTMDQTMYSIDNGAYEIEESEIAHFYPEEDSV